MLLSEKIEVISPKFSMKSKIKPKLNLFLIMYILLSSCIAEENWIFNFRKDLELLILQLLHMIKMQRWSTWKTFYLCNDHWYIYNFIFNYQSLTLFLIICFVLLLFRLFSAFFSFLFLFYRTVRAGHKYERFFIFVRAYDFNESL